MKRINIIYLASTLCLLLFAVSVEAKGIKEKVADSYYNNLAYEKAVSYYVELAESKRANAEILRKTADSYNKIGDTENAVKWYKALYEKDWANNADKYDYILALRKIGEYAESLKVLKNYLDNGGQSTPFTEYMLAHPNYIEELKEQNKDKYAVQVIETINSEEHDFGPTYYEKGILFASPEKRGERAIRRKFAWDNTNFLQLYYTEKGEDGTYTEPKMFSFSKKSKYHDGPVAFNTDFTEAYLTRSNYSSKGKLTKSEQNIVEVNLFTSKRNEDGSWSELVPFPYNSPEYSIGNATISRDGSVLVFASDMPGGEGMSDLWMCKREGDSWGTPVHLGNKINTNQRDNFPWLDKDGNLYFASDGGIQGIGGYDIYWIPGFMMGKDNVYNVGAPINSPADDFGLVYDSETATGYFNSGREGVMGIEGRDDIFGFTKFVSLLEVKIVDKATGLPIKGALGCVKTKQGDFLEKDIKTNDEAIFSRELVANTYGICASAKGYNDATETIILPKGKFVTTTIELERFIPKPPPCPQITLEDIFYDFDKYVIRDDASTALDELVVFLKEVPQATINLTSHTDSRGTHKYNDWLSEKRAESAKNYLVAKGIDAARINARGVGERELLNKCADGVPCTKREHQANRRTVVEIITDGCLEVTKKPNKYLD